MSPRVRSRLTLVAPCLFVALWAGPAAADHHEEAPAKVEVVSSNVQGKNVYIPSTIVVEAAKAHVLSLFNTTDTPHGFSIGAAGIEVVMPPGEEMEVPLPPLEAGIYRVHCQLHPPHRSGTLLVVDTP